MTTTTKEEKEKAAKAALKRDKKKAEELAITYGDLIEKEEKCIAEYTEAWAPFHAELEKNIAAFKENFEKKMEPLVAGRTKAAEKLIEIGERQKKTLFTDSNWRFENGYYLHIKSVTKEKLDKAFDLSKFIKKFGEYVKVNYKISELQKAFLDTKQRKSFMKFGFDLDTNESIEIKKKATR